MEKNNKNGVVPKIVEERDWNESKLALFISSNFSYVLLGVLLTLLFSGIFFLIMPKYRQISSTKEMIADENAMCEAKEKSKTDLEEYHKIYGQLIETDDIDRVNEMLPDRPDDGNFEWLMGEIDALAAENGLLLNSISIIDSDKKEKKQSDNVVMGDSAEIVSGASLLETPDGVGRVYLEIDLLGADYPKVRLFLDSVEKNLDLIDVTDIAFAPGSNKISLRALSYYLR